MFQAVLSSNCSLSNYPSNSGGCFHADLNETLHFNKFSWEVALSELIIIPNSWYLIREPFNSFSFRIHKLKVEQLSLEKYLFQHWRRLREPFKLTYIGIAAYSGFHGREEFSYRKFKNVFVFDKRFKSRNNWNTINYPKDTQEYSFYYVDDTFMYEDKYPAEFVGKIVPGNYSASELLEIIIKQCNDFLQIIIGNMKSKNIVLANRADIDYIDKTSSESMFSSVKHSDEKLEIKINETFASKITCQFKLPSQLNFILGFSVYLYQPEIWCAACKGVVAPKAIVNTLTNLYVFCDFIVPMFFNDKQIPLLRQVDCSESSGQIQHETFSNLLFKDISKTSIKTIKIWFSEYACGYPIFEMRSPSTVILVFRSI